MAGGFAKDGAVQEQIDASVADEVSRARQQIPKGESATHCNECGEPIPLARRTALAGVRRCVACQEEADAHHKAFSGYNRRGSKGSQLK